MAMAWRNIELSVGDRVATITLNRPPLNILNLEMINELSEALAELSGRKELGVLVIKSGIKQVFSAGADVKEHLPEMADELINRFDELIKALTFFPRPTISVVEGTCLGGGMELAVSCDFVVAAEKATFGQPEIRVGVYPPAAAALLPRIAGLKNAYRVILTGRRFTAREAAEMGLVTHLVEDGGSVEARLSELVAELLESSGAVLGVAKRAVYGGLAMSLEDALSYSSRLYLQELMETSDAVEGLRAFLEKRRPEWRNE